MDLPADAVFLTTLADASPYRGREMYLQETVYVRASQILESEDAVRQLSLMDFDSLLSTGDEAERLRVHGLHNLVRSAIHRHCHCPAFLGAKQLGVLTKLQATLHTVGLESSGLPAIVGWLTSVGSITVDMGTEGGLGLLPKVPLSMITQSWRWQAREVPLADGGGDDNFDMPLDEENCGDVSKDFSENIFTRAIVIPGIMHLMHNTSFFVMSKLQCLGKIRVQLQALCAVLNQSNILQRIRRTCFSGREALFDRIFHSIVPLLVRWRWGSIQMCLSRLLEVRKPLCKFWSLAKYLAGSVMDEDLTRDAAGLEGKEGGDKGDRAAYLTQLKHANDAIQDEFFWGACTMLHSLQSVLVEVESYCSGCPCHGSYIIAKERTRFRRTSVYQRVAGLDDKEAFCPLSGCRCPEVAGGQELDRTMRAAADMQERSVFQDVMADESTEMREGFTHEWHVGLALLMTGLVEKLTFWTQLPHLLCALASWDPTKVQWCAGRSLDLYDQLEEKVHHPLSRLFLSSTDPNSFRAHVETLAQGGQVRDLPNLVRIFICQMRFWSLLETPIEEKHARLSRTINRNSNWSGALVSLALRLPQFIRETASNPEVFREVVHHFQQALGSGHAFIIQDLNLDQHPEVVHTLYRRCQLADKRKQTITGKLAKSIVYHADPESQFVTHSEGARLVSAQRKRREQVLREAMRAGVAAGLQPLLRETPKTTIRKADTAEMIVEKISSSLVAPHLQTLLQEGSVYSLPPLSSCVGDAQNLGSVALPLSHYLRVERTTSEPNLPDHCLDGGLELVPDMGSSITQKTELDGGLELVPDMGGSITQKTEVQHGVSVPVFFTVLQCAPSKAKVLRSTVAHGRLPSSSITVIFHDPEVDKHRFQASKEITALHSSSMIPMALNLSLLRASTLQTKLYKWTISERIEYALENAPPHNPPITGDAKATLTHLMRIGAVPGASQGYRNVGENANREAELQILETLDLVENVQGEYFLTELALRNLRSKMVLSSPTVVPLLRSDVSVVSMTLLELLGTLDERGWKAERAQLGKSLPPYMVGNEKIWYLKSGLSRWYMVTLLHAEDLNDLGVLSIEHGRQQTYYRQFFDKGKPMMPKDQATEATTDRDFALEDDFGGGEELPKAAAAAIGSDFRANVCEPLEDACEQGDTLRDWLTDVFEEVPEEPQELPSRIPGPPDSQQLLLVPSGASSSSSQLVVAGHRLPPREAPQPARVGPVLAQSSSVGDSFDYYNHHGDRFRMTPKGAPLGSTAGGKWQCSCYVHEGDRVTRGVTLCTRTRGVDGLEALMAWADAARDYATKGEHQGLQRRPRVSGVSAPGLRELAAGDDDGDESSSSGSSSSSSSSEDSSS